jgi:hypothetical protein
MGWINKHPVARTNWHATWTTQITLLLIRIVRNKAYPALARWQADLILQNGDSLGNTGLTQFPAVRACLTHTAINYKLSDFKHLVRGAYYTVGLGFFNFDVDYFALNAANIRRQLREKNYCVVLLSRRRQSISYQRSTR